MSRDATLAWTDPTLAQAWEHYNDLVYLEKRGQWRDGVPEWCAEVSRFTNISPALVATSAWAGVAKAFAAALLNPEQADV